MLGQAIAIGLVIVAGISTYVAMTGVMHTLQRTLDAYYADYRFADGFASIRRAPESVADRIREVDGISTVMTRVVAAVNLEIPGFDEPVTGQIVSIPASGQPALNRLLMRSGRLPTSGREQEIVLNEAFAEAHGLLPGDEITAIINGRRRALSVVGIALSPEYLMQIEPGSIFPDPERFGVMWMSRPALAAANDMVGAFNDVAYALAPGARIEDVNQRVELVLEPYGGQGAFGRSKQSSHFIISEEFRQLEGMSTMLPVIFLAVAAFLLNIVVTRLIHLQREQIAVLKAFGYSNLAVGLHYARLVAVIAIVGAIVGSTAGIWLGRQLSALYLVFYRFPYLEHVFSVRLVLTAVALTTGASLLGVVFAVRRAVRLSPAEAMRPAPPARYRPTMLERLGLQRLLDQPSRIILRNLERQPVKALLSVVGIASSCAILITGLFSTNAFDYMIRVQFGIAQQEDLTVTFVQPTSTAAVHELRSLQGVIHAEGFRSVPVRFRRGHRTYDGAVEGVPPTSHLRHIVDVNLRPVPVPRQGIVLTDRLARLLDVRPGQMLDVEVREGTRRTHRVAVVGLAQQYIGMGAYMDVDALNRLAGSGQAVSGAFLMIDDAHEDALTRALRERPRVAAISSTERVIEAFFESSAGTMITYTFILSLFAGVISFGVIYNSARIALSERDRELASLRVLGFTRGEISYILLGELAVLVFLAIPLGMLLGIAASGAIVQGLETDLYEIPVVINRHTLALASMVVLISAVFSALIVRRRLYRLDLISVLKTRE